MFMPELKDIQKYEEEKKAKYKDDGYLPGEREYKTFDVKKDFETWPSKGEYTINIILPEFSCLCPRSGYPDFACLYLNYLPKDKIVELKALKLYVNSFYNTKKSHEAVCNEILNTLKDLLDPVYIELIACFNPRGNVFTKVVCSHGDKQKYLNKCEAVPMTHDFKAMHF